MKVPKIFLPEKDLEGKINDLSKESYKKRIRPDSDPPSLKELRERTNPIFEDCLKTIYGERRYHSINLEGVPDNYRGWIDFTITNNYEAKTYYCTLFDAKSEKGIELKNKFLKSYKGNNVYDFKPYKKFSVKGKLVKESYTNDFWWFILTVDELYKK